MSERHPGDSTCGIPANNGGFTLGELLVSIAIVAVLSTVALLSYGQYADDAETSKARASAAGVETTIVAESTATTASPRAFITHVPSLAHSGSQTSVGGIPVTLLAGDYGENGTNYSAGYPDWNKLKLDPARFGMTTGTSDVLVGALDANANGRGSTSYTQTAVVAGKKYAITGTYPTGQPSAVPGLIVSPKDPGKALVDGTEAGSLVCPPGFAKVPGNPEFPTAAKDFCLAKYEMKYADLSDKIQDTGFSAAASVAGGGRAMTWRYATGATIVSKPETNPVSWVTQRQALEACATMGTGYHLVTNDEWMAAARNVESVGDNWSGGSVGAGGLYAGNSMWETALTCDAGGGNYASGTADYTAEAASDSASLGAKRTSCDAKRQLKLTNGEILWDMAGNSWEHVNGGNSLDGSGNAVFPARACSNSPTATIHELAGTVMRGASTSYACTYEAPYSYETHGPKTPGMNYSNGMGRIYHVAGSTDTDRVFMRGGNGHVGDSAGIYSLLLFFGNDGQAGGLIGFRCAYR